MILAISSLHKLVKKKSPEVLAVVGVASLIFEPMVALKSAIPNAVAVKVSLMQLGLPLMPFMKLLPTFMSRMSPGLQR